MKGLLQGNSCFGELWMCAVLALYGAAGSNWVQLQIGRAGLTHERRDEGEAGRKDECFFEQD